MLVRFEWTEPTVNVLLLPLHPVVDVSPTKVNYRFRVWVFKELRERVRGEARPLPRSAVDSGFCARSLAFLPPKKHTSWWWSPVVNSSPNCTRFVAHRNHHPRFTRCTQWRRAKPCGTRRTRPAEIGKIANSRGAFTTDALPSEGSAVLLTSIRSPCG